MPPLTSGGHTQLDVAAQKQDLVRQLASSSGPNEGLVVQLKDNPFFTAGFGLAALGTAATLGQKGLRHGAALLRRRLIVDVEINVKDPSYPWFLYWMTVHQRRQLASSTARMAKDGLPAKKVGFIERLIQRLTPGMRHLAIETKKIELPNGAMQAHFALVPGPGKHILRYRNAFIMVNRQRDSKMTTTSTGVPWETVTLTTLYSQRHIFEHLFREAHAQAAQSVEGKTVIYNQWGSHWQKFGNPRSKRPLDSVILDEGVKDKILADIEDFLRSARWYHDRGIPYRRGYLLHGPPGTGKSSFIQALAGYLDYDIALLNLNERGLTDDKLNHLLTIIPQRTLVLLEDVDATSVAHRSHRTPDPDGYTGANVTFSGLLNALDGVASAEERIIFFTTNHVERLDPALVRPGRVDLTVRLGNATTFQVDQLWDRFYADLPGHKEYKARFCQALAESGLLEDSTRLPGEAANDRGGVGGKISTAGLQGLFLYNKGDMQGAIDAIPHLTTAVGLGGTMTTELNGSTEEIKSSSPPRAAVGK